MSRSFLRRKAKTARRGRERRGSTSRLVTRTILGTISNPRLSTGILLFMPDLWSAQLRAKTYRFLRVFAGFCSFIVNILAMRRTIQIRCFGRFCWQFAKIVSSKPVSLRGKGEEMSCKNLGLFRRIGVRTYTAHTQLLFTHKIRYDVI